jgi:hypothetical protein
LKEKFGAGEVQVELVVGDKGVFDVFWDDRKVFSKHEAGRFPAYGEVPLAIDLKRIEA